MQLDPLHSPLSSNLSEKKDEVTKSPQTQSSNGLKLDNKQIQEKLVFVKKSESQLPLEKKIIPKKNILFSLFDTIGTIAKKSFYGLGKPKNLSEMDFIREQNPELAKDFANADHILTQSENQDLSLKFRMDCSPERTSSGLSGSYFLKIAESYHPDKPEDTKQMIEEGTANLKDAFIIKPSIQEFGSKGNPEMLLTPDGQFGSSGIQPGKGAIREKLGDIVQATVGLDFGIPPTGLTKVKNRQLGLPTESDLQLRKLTNKWGMRMTPQVFVKFSGEDFNAQTFKTKLITKVLEEIQELGGEKLHTYYIQQFVKIDNKEQANFLLTKEYSELNNALGDRLNCLARIITEAKYSTTLDQELKLVWDELNVSTKGSEEVVASFQKLAVGCVSLFEISAKEKSDWICPKEFEKFALDILLLNTDRHDQNVLVKETSLIDVSKRLSGEGLDMEKLQEFIEKMKESTGDINLNSENHLVYVEKFLEGLPKELQGNEKIESGIHNLFFAEFNRYNTTYELVLIDQGNCLPDPDFSLEHLKVSISCWAYMPQGDSKLSGVNRNKVLALNIDKTINKIKETQQIYAKRYGSDCEMSTACYHLMKLNLIVLKNIAEMNVSIKVGVMIVRQKDLIGIYKNNIVGSTKIDWKKIDSLVKEAIKAKIQ